MTSSKDYVAGWLDSSICDFLKVLRPNTESAKYALVTCLDSNLEPKSLLRRDSALWAMSNEIKPIGNPRPRLRHRRTPLWRVRILSKGPRLANVAQRG